MASRFDMYKNHGKHICTCNRGDCEDVVRQGLAYSPADMARMTEKGMPVNSLLNGKAFIDGEENPSFDVTDDRQRFVDVAELWEKHQIRLDKARNAARARKLKESNK